MRISLRTSSQSKEIAAYNSPVVPRVGELVRLANKASIAQFRVIDVCYQAQDTQDAESDLVHLEIMPANEDACAYLGKVLYS